jgi:hypothetical protein
MGRPAEMRAAHDGSGGCALRGGTFCLIPAFGGVRRAIRVDRCGKDWYLREGSAGIRQVGAWHGGSLHMVRVLGGKMYLDQEMGRPHAVRPFLGQGTAFNRTRPFI